MRHLELPLPNRRVPPILIGVNDVEIAKERARLAGRVSATVRPGPAILQQAQLSANPITRLRCLEQLGIEDGAWTHRPTPEELLVVFGSGPILPSMVPTGEFMRQALAYGDPPRDPEHLLETLRRRTTDARLLSATAAWWRADSLEIAWVGDVRGHLIRRDRLVASTKDHTLAKELAITGHSEDRDALARIVTRTLGGPGPRPDTQSWSLRPGDALLLCAAHLHDFRPPARYLDEALEFARMLPGRLMIKHDQT